MTASWAPDAENCAWNAQGTGDMVFTGGVGCNATLALGTGTSIRFPNDGNAVVGNTLFNTRRDQSIRLWVYMNSYKQALNDQDTLFSTYDGVTRWIHSGFGDTSCANMKRFYIVTSVSDGLPHVVCASSDPPTQTWLHLVVTIDSLNATHSNITLYQDGVYSASDIHYVENEELGNLTFGDLGTLGRRFDGNLGPIAIWDITLTAKDVRKDYRTSRHTKKAPR